MRPISGFDRPSFQYLFVVLSVVLIAVGAWGAVSVRRASREIERLHASELNGRLEREQLEARAAREQSARESLALQIARSSNGETTTAKKAEVPSLTLTPLSRRGPTPPPPTVAPPQPLQVIALRLMLPRGVDPHAGRYHIAIRNWEGGQTIWSRGALAATRVEGRGAVQAYLTGEVFGAGSYEALLTATGPDGTLKEIASYELTVGSVR
jgi:hypothetical protein